MLDAEPLTVDEVASLLGLSRNTVYKLAKESQLPSYRIGRKLRFSRSDIEAQLKGPSKTQQSEQSNASLSELASSLATSSSPRVRIGGSDALSGTLAHHLSQLGAPAITSPMSSYAALVNLYAGNVDLALVNLYDYRTNSYNTPYIQRLCPGIPLVSYRVFKRRQGFIVRAGNPLSISTWGSLLRENVRIAGREKGCSSQILLDQKLLSMGVNFEEIQDRITVCTTPVQAAMRVASGAADVCIGCREDALASSGLQFVPALTECVDVVARKSSRTKRTIKALKHMTTDGKFCQELDRIMDCDPSTCGAIVYEC